MKRYVMALDLVGDPQLIKEYEDYHREVWPEIKRSILDAGILQMEIYRFENRSAMDAANEKVQEWEQLMWKYQAAIPGAKPGEKWVMMTKIFELV